MLAMKALFPIILLTAACTFFNPGISLAGPFYVVVATFSTEPGARQFAHSFQGTFEQASFRFNEKKELYYVHLMETSRQADAENFRNHLQDNFGFRDAWVYADLNTGVPASADESNEGYVKLELHTGGSVLLNSADNTYVSVSKHHAEKKPTIENRQTPVQQAFVFIAETRAGTLIPAKVSVSDTKGNLISVFKTGEAVSVGGKQDSRILTLHCDVPGFNAITKMINLANPATLDIQPDSAGIWEVRFTLIRQKADEVAFVFHHMFHGDAAIFEPAARETMDVLVGALKGNPSAKIVINSHCNTGEKRRIKLPGAEEHPFDLDEAVEKTGSDKLLTKARAEALRNYLVGQGIEADRISLFGWGSMNLLVNSAADNRSVNDRVEVQLISGL